MASYGQYTVADLKMMMRGIGMTAKQWPGRKKEMLLKLAEWDKAHPHDIAANRRVAAGGLARSQASTAAAPVPAPAFSQPKDGRKRRQSTPLAEANARTKRQKTNEGIDEASDVEDTSSTAKPTRLLKIRLRKPPSATRPNVAGHRASTHGSAW
jgi:hypothetical protein